MSEQIRFKSAHELREIQGATASAVLPVEVAYTLPFPKKTEAGIMVEVLFYNEKGPPGQRVVSLPHYAMHLDPKTGIILRFWAIRPEEMGIVEPLTPVPGAGIDPNLTSDEFFILRQRFLDISNVVWEAYASGKSEFEASAKAIIKEYETLFLRITKREVAPFYVASSPHFFNWLRTISHSD